jgi:conjugal transfer pilin signal peptidase TrbI
MKNIVLSLIFGLLGSMIFTVVHDYFYVRQIAVVKLDDVIASHIKEYAGKKVSEDERKSISERFARALDFVIKRISDEERVILMASPAVVSGVPDYTEQIKAEIERLLNEK